MTITQIARFFENKDTASFSYKKFNESPLDEYPTFSICFKGTYTYLENDEPLFDSFGIDSRQYELVMKGEHGARYEYDMDSRLYKKVLINIENVSSIGFHQEMYLNINSFMKSAVSLSQTSMALSGKDNAAKQIEFYIGYQTDNMICFTRLSNDTSKVIRLYDELVLDFERFKKAMYKDSELAIYLHSPYQLWRSSDTPKFAIQFSKLISDYSSLSKTKHNIKLQISQVTVVRKRPNSNDPCNELLQRDDDKLQKEIARNVKCIPPYWKTTLVNYTEFGECRTASQLNAANLFINNYKDVLDSYQGPCTDMKILSTNEKDEKYIYDGRNETVMIRFEYMEKYYQEIINGQEFSFETFWSAVGGFLGIFMGYSMLQLPDFFAFLHSLLRNFKP